MALNMCEKGPNHKQTSNKMIFFQDERQKEDDVKSKSKSKRRGEKTSDVVSSCCVEWIVGRRKKRTFCPGEETREEGRVEAAEDYGKDINLEKKDKDYKFIHPTYPSHTL